MHSQSKGFQALLIVLLFYIGFSFFNYSIIEEDGLCAAGGGLVFCLLPTTGPGYSSCIYLCDNRVVASCDMRTVWRKSICLLYVIIFGLAGLLLPPSNWFLKPEPNFILSNIEHFIAYPKEYVEACFEKIRDPRYDWKNQRDAQIQVGEFIKRNYFRGTTFVYDQMGRVPYQAGIDFNIIDSNGLADKKIGRTYFFQRSKSSPVLRFYERVSRHIIGRCFPDEGFYLTKEEIVDYVFAKRPDVVLCLVPMNTMIIQGLASDDRFRKNYHLKYSINLVLFFERKGLAVKPLDIPAGLDVMFAEEVLDGDFPDKNVLLNVLKHNA